MRFSPPANRSHEKTYLSGYGVALDLKKTDYLAVDDRQTGKKGPLQHITAPVTTAKVCF